MTLQPGTRLGSYEILSPLGAGGMGEVYRATDSRLDRQVAIKVLPEAFTQDPERLTRFEREAKVLAQLQHPNIASIFGLEEAGGVRALVMELIEGPTLAERLALGPIPLEESLGIALQIAEALESAHEKGIIHRDLKPANVKLGPDGRVKVLDFGLAKALDSGTQIASTGGAASMLSQSPTLVHGATQMGVILGTAAYMSPEQASGGHVDRRADIWSFGVVLYEMLSGRRLFDGETTSHVLASVLKDTPDFEALPAGTPRRLAELLRRCLRRKPRERLQSIGDARLEIEEVLADPRRDERETLQAGGVAVAAPAGSPSRAAWIVAGAALGTTLLFAVLWMRGSTRAAPAHLLHAALVAPAGMAFGDTFAVSPDGSRVVFEAFDQKTGARSLWLRPLDHDELTQLAPTDGGEMPFWSPDGSHIGFFAEGKLRRLDLQGGTAQTICDAPTPRGGAWSPDDNIVFTDAFRTGLSIVSASGGSPKTLTTLDAARGEKSHRFPVFLPGGRILLFLAQTAEGGSRNDQSAIEALDLASLKRTSLIQVNSSPLYSPTGDILFWRDGTLLATHFDPSRLTVSWDPKPVAAPVAFSQNEEALASISGEGTLVYREGNRGTYSSLVWLDRRGVGVGREVIRGHELFNEFFALSHDGRRVVYGLNAAGQGSTDLWVHDLDRATASRLTFEDGSETYPVWSPDDRFIYYSNDRRNDGVLFRRPSDGTGTAEEIGTTPTGIWPMAASKDGRWLVVGTVGGQSGRDLLRFDLSTKEVAPLVTSPSFDQDASLSPDDRYLAYASEQSGRWEVYVQALGGGQGKWQISSEGGQGPGWRADGREIVYLTRPDRLMSVTVEPGEVPRFSQPRELFRHPIQRLDITSDGQWIVGLRPADTDTSKPLTLVSGWTQLLPR